MGRGRARTTLRWIGGAWLLLLLLAGAGIFFLLQTGPGHEYVLRLGLSQLREHVNGEVEVAGLRSDGLLRGFTLHGVAIRDAGGRPMLEADSVRVRYSVRDLVRRNLVVMPAEVWRPRVTVETLHGDTVSNVGRIFPTGEPDAPPSGPGFALALRDVEVRGGELSIRIPVEEESPPGGGVFETLSDREDLYRVFRFTELDARIEEADLLTPGLVGQRFTFRDLSLTGEVLEEPFRIEEFRGDVYREGARIFLRADRLRLPATELSGWAMVDWGREDGGVALDADLEAATLQFADFRWIEPRLPEGGGRLAATVEGPVAEGRWRIRSADLEVGGSRIRGEVGFDLGPEFRIAASDLELAPLELALLEPWLEDPPELGGLVRGRLRGRGVPGDLELDGELTYEDPAREVPATTARFAGRFHPDRPGVTDLSLTLDPLRYGTLQAFFPDHPLSGEGRLEMEARGDLDGGLVFTGEVLHALEEGFPSRVTLAGSVRGEEEDFVLSLDGVLDPLSLDGLARALGRELPVRGWVAGPVRVEGALSDLVAFGRLNTPAGGLEAEARLDVREPTRAYRIEGRVEGFRLHELLPDLPDPTVANGEFRVDGAGGTPETLAGEARIRLRDSRVSGAEVERLDAFLRATGGRLFVEEFEVASSVLTASASGNLGLREGARDGRMRVRWEAESLAGLRPVLLDEETLAADTLSALERDILRLEGLDPDTLVPPPDVPLGGRAAGELELTGWLRDLTAEGFAEVEDGVFGEHSIGWLRVDASGGWRGEEDWDVRGELEVERASTGRFRFLGASGELGYAPRSGDFRVEVRRTEDESYRTEGAFRVDSASVEVALRDLAVDLDGVEWRLEEPTGIRLAGSAVRVEPLVVARTRLEGEDEVRFAAGGLLDLEGESDLQLRLEAVELAHLRRLAQIESGPDGVLDLSLAVRGPSEAPRMDGSLAIRDFSVEGAALSRLEGEVSYADRLLETHLVGELDGRVLLSVDGRVPADLSFREVEDRLSGRDVEITLAVDSLPAATALAFLDFLEGVEGTLDGEMHLRGDPDDLLSAGELRLRGGALSLPEQGFRAEGIQADFRLREDRTVEVAGEARARGVAEVSGTISLEDVRDPAFDLRISSAGFQVVDRRDLVARAGGEVTLTGSFRAPRLGGQVRVEQGSLFLEEFARVAEVIDLSDPAFFDVVDTTLVAVRPVVEAAQNPFVQNLRVDVDLTLQRDFWLRSREMNVEMAGDLVVTFDRPARELLLVGRLDAVRGTYVAFGRQFHVEDGGVEFVGTPGINPALDIRAVNRLRREGGEPLNIFAEVDGTLVRPRVRLTTDAQPPIAESDLISYLLFGRPSYALASGETSILEGAVGAGVGVGVGALATQLGAVLAQEIGLDYFTITQAREGVGNVSAAGLGGTFADTQIEMGQYVGENFFLALILRPLTGLGAHAQTQLPGARLEWRFADLWVLEGFVEDRFAREGISGFGELGIRFSKMFGLFVYREWGY